MMSTDGFKGNFDERFGASRRGLGGQLHLAVPSTTIAVGKRFIDVENRWELDKRKWSQPSMSPWPPQQAAGSF
jgi:hypothetical protein